MKTVAVVVERPEHLALRTLDIAEPGDDDVLIEVEWSGISTGTERLLWSGRMPTFPGMGYPLVPGYETVGKIVGSGARHRLSEGTRVFVPGANCYGGIKALFGGAASHIVTSAQRTIPVPHGHERDGILIALAATAYHALTANSLTPPQLIVGHGVLGRLLARVSMALGNDAPIVWERNPARRQGSTGYDVIDPKDDDGRAYASIYDVSGDGSQLDALIRRLAKGGEITLAGFYESPLSFAFPAAFMREARIRVSAEWIRPDIDAVTCLIESGALKLDGLITHNESADRADHAYRTAFEDPACLKMVLDWRGHA
jgi:3-hydroxyethyl bacteriochlorophyllide a dehydrogenase